MVWLQVDPARSGWIREIHGGLGIVAEFVLAAVEAEAEKWMLTAELEDDNQPSPAMRAGLSRALRFFAEGQANYLVVAGHGLANVTLRTLALHRSFDIDSVARDLQIDSAQFAPRQTERGAWASLNSKSARTLDRCAKQTGLAELGAVTGDLRRLAGDEAFLAIMELRGEQYHRWRGESPGVTGVSFDGPTMLERLNAGEAVGMSRELLPAYSEGEAVLQDLALIVHQPVAPDG